jgi:hypothetical protein
VAVRLSFFEFVFTNIRGAEERRGGGEEGTGSVAVGLERGDLLYDIYI